MRAFILCHGTPTEPSPLLRLAGKAILFHLLEKLHREGVRQATLIVHHFPEQIEYAVGSGDRFGIDISYLLCHQMSHPLKEAIIISKTLNPSTPLIIASGDSLPLEKHAPSPASYIQNCPLNISIEDFLPHSSFLSTHPFETLLSSNIAALSLNNLLHLSPKVKEVAPHSFVHKTASIHKQALLTPPYYIGKHVRIAKKATIGPNAIIERNSIIDEKAEITDSLILENSYIGKYLSLNNTVIHGKNLFHLRSNTTLHITDKLLLSSLQHSSLWKKTKVLLEKKTALFLHLLFLPITVFYSRKDKKSSSWKTFSDQPVKELLINLPLIAKGKAHFVGLKPTPPLPLLSKEHKDLYDAVGIGWAYIDEDFIAAAYYAQKQSFLEDLKLFLKKIIDAFSKNY